MKWLQNTLSFYRDTKPLLQGSIAFAGVEILQQHVQLYLLLSLSQRLSLWDYPVSVFFGAFR